MKAEIEVLQPGLFSSIQDMGRFGYQKFGVPQSGVMDRYAMRVCNLILGNHEDTAVMEITLQGPHLKFDASASVCISGADLSPLLNGEPIHLNQIVQIKQGDILKFGRRKTGCRAYLGISGGFLEESLMDSKSWYEGLTACFRLEKGMRLCFEPETKRNLKTHSAMKIDKEYFSSEEIEVYPGPEFERLSEKQKESLLNISYKTDENSNRMAIQLKDALENKLKPITTGPVLPGTVQLTPSGKIIILMRDCQTTGGYPRILQLSEYGQQVLAQKLPGEKINFKKLEYQGFLN